MKDIDLSFNKHPLTGDLATKSGSSAIQQSLRNICLTNWYERGFNVDLAANLHASLFDNIGTLEVQTIKDNMTQAIKNFEPRVEVIQVLVSKGESDNELLATVIYNEFNDPEEKSFNIVLDRIR